MQRHVFAEAGRIQSAWVLVLSLEEGVKSVRDRPGVPTDQGRAWEKVRSLDVLLTGG